MWIGDVGQNRWEEINFQPASSDGGENYGWDCFEGSATFAMSSSECGNDTYTDPVFEYFNDNDGDGCSVTGGFVYRGSDYPELFGKYIFTDFCSGKFWAIEQLQDGTFETEELANFNNFDYSSFGEDQNGELYVAGLASGTIYRLTELCSAFTTENLSISQSDNMLSVPENFSNYQWLLNGEPIAEANSATLEATVSGTYAVEVTNELGCAKISEELEFVVTSVKKLQLAALQIQPNPFEENVWLEIVPNQAADFQIEIRNALGRLVFSQQQFIQGRWTSTLPLNNLSPGVYFMTIRSAGKEVVRKLVKQ